MTTLQDLKAHIKNNPKSAFGVIIALIVVVVLFSVGVWALRRTTSSVPLSAVKPPMPLRPSDVTIDMRADDVQDQMPESQ